VVQADVWPWPVGQVVHVEQAPLSFAALKVLPEVHAVQVVSCVVLQGDFWPWSVGQVEQLLQAPSSFTVLKVLYVVQA
jgi:hypothetical protein